MDIAGRRLLVIALPAFLRREDPVLVHHQLGAPPDVDRVHATDIYLKVVCTNGRIDGILSPGKWRTSGDDMDRIFGKGGLRAAGAALLVFAALLFAAPTPSSAASYTISFTGTVTATNDPFGNPGGVFAAAGIIAGDPVSGTLTINPLTESPDLLFSDYSRFLQPSLTYTFNVSHPAGADLHYVQSGHGQVVSQAGTFGNFISFFATIDGVEGLSLNFLTTPPGTGSVLTSLVGLPNTPAALFAMLGGAPSLALGSYNPDGHVGSVIFDIAFSTAVTPIPAALPLFASALAGLGFVSWRRKNALAG
jgi:hypothetical protein